MFSFAVSQKQLAKVIGLCRQISPSKSDVDLFTFVRFEVEDGHLSVFSTNGQVFYTAKIELADLDFDSQKAQFLVKTDDLNSIIHLLPEEQVLLQVNLQKNTLLLQGARSKHNLRIQSNVSEDFGMPQEDLDKPQVKISLKASDLLEANRLSFISVGQSKNVHQPEYLHICYNIKAAEQSLSIVSTDRFRITHTVLPVEILTSSEELQQEGNKVNFLFLPKSLQLLGNLLAEEDQVEAKLEKDLAWFSLGNQTLVLRYGEAKYPDYERIIPQSFACSFEISGKEFLDSLKQVSWCIRSDINRSLTLFVRPGSNQILVQAKNQDGDSSESLVNIQNYQGSSDEWQQSFNADYLMDYVSGAKIDTFLWEANPGRPSVLSPLGDKAKQFYLVSGLK